MAAAVYLVKTHTGEFIPPPGVLRKAITPTKAAHLEVAPLIRRIEKLATYNPNAGMIYPPTSVVQEQLGDEAAYAYAAAGGPRLFSESDTSRDIAQREFASALTEAIHRSESGLPTIAAPKFQPRLKRGDTNPTEAP
jgi:hypothetical protein